MTIIRATIRSPVLADDSVGARQSCASQEQA